MFKLDTSRLSQKSLQKRFLSALFLGPLSLLLVYLGGFWFQGFLFLICFLCFYEWFSVAQKTKFKLVLNGVGFVYLSAAFLSFYIIREHLGFEAAILFMITIWASDIVAYFTGKIGGGPKFWAQISPNKTWAGFAGAMIGPAIIMLLYFTFLHPSVGEGTHSVQNIVFTGIAGAVFGVIAQIGDLLVSAFKRLANVKDTGHLIPGHGGILDRMDSLLLVAPFYYALLTYLMSK